MRKKRAAEPYDFFEKSLERSDAINKVPKKLGNIPEMAVLLGLISPKFYKIYNLCDGKKISEIAAAMNLDTREIVQDIDKLIKNKMVEL